MKRILILAAGILQVPVIKKAREMGYFVIAADGDTNAVGLKYANKAIVANITDEKVMLQVAREEHVDGVIHPCSEVSVLFLNSTDTSVILFILGVSGWGRDIPQHMGVPRLGVELELQLPASATATHDLSLVCDLLHRSRPARSLTH